MTQRLEGRTALVTGASRGIGRAVALRFAREGAHVIAVARTRGGLEELDDAIKAEGGSATLVELDLADNAKIDGLAAPIFERWSKLDVLVANAAIIGRLTPLAHYPPDLWEKVIATNLSANWRLIRALDPLLRAAPAGRAIFVTSGVARRNIAYWGAYAVTKAAVEKLALTWAEEVAQSNLRINIINPGPTRTAMRAQAYPGEDPKTLQTPDSLTEFFVQLAEPACTLHGQLVAAQG
jgi:NAD(P)-dependent dehydrogenase (short-subunit alcohol dehydrogenase family)